MFRLTVNSCLMLAILAGPGLCCCTGEIEAAQLSATRCVPDRSEAGSTVPRQCACHQDAKQDQQPERCPACPCEDQRQVLTAHGPSDLHIAQPHDSAHWWHSHPLLSSHVVPDALSVNGMYGVASFFVEAALPSGREILCAHCVLRC